MNDDNSRQREETLHTHSDHDVSSFWFDLNSLNTLENMSTFDNMMCKMNNVGCESANNVVKDAGTGEKDSTCLKE